MVPGVFSAVFDHEQTRVTEYPVFASIQGFGWDGKFSQPATWIEPLTHTLMLRPMSRYFGWQATNTGIYAKPAFSAYEFETSGNWAAAQVIDGGGQTFCQAKASTNPGWIRTVTAPGKNRGVNVALFGYGAGEYAEIAQFGWDDTDTTFDGSALGFRLYSDGVIEVYKAGEYVGQGKIGIGTSGAKNVPLEFLLLPMRKRELLVLGMGNDGFRIVFDDILETDTSPTITPAEKFWLKMATSDATRAQVQIAPCKFETSGYATSVQINFQRPPVTGATARTWTNPVFTGITSANLYGDKAYAGTTNVSAVSLVETDGTTAFVADGTLNTALMKLTMTGDGSYTPFVYGAVMAFEGETDVTNDAEEADLDDYLVSLDFEVPDDPWGVRARLVYLMPEAAEAVVAKLRTIGNRPVKITCDSIILLDGRTGEPRFIDGLSDETMRVEIECFDLTRQVENYRFRDQYPLDGFYLSYNPGTNNSAVREVLRFTGLADSQMELSSDTFRLPEIAGETCETYSYPVPVGDTGRQAIESLHSNFAANWFIGVKPTATVPKFHFQSPADVGTTSLMTVYRRVDAAVSASMPPTQVYSKHRQELEEVNANEVVAIGQDPRTGQIVMAWARDAASQDPTTLPSLRPENWLGESKSFGVQDPRFRTLADCERAVQLLVPAVMSKRTFGQFETAEMLWYNSDPGGTDLMLPIWRSETVTLEDVGDVQISSLSFSVVRNASGTLVTNASYTYGGMTNAGGRTLASIQASNRARYQIAQRFNLAAGFGYGLFQVTRRVEV